MTTTPPTNRPDPAWVQHLDADGALLQDAVPPPLDDATLLDLYETMAFARAFDERAVSLQRQGRIGTYAPMAGSEAAQVASAMALGDADWVYPTYRDHAAKLVRGVEPGRLLAAMAGHPEGSAMPAGVTVLPEYIPVATQVPQATGTAMAARYAGTDAAVLCYLGDGATSEGDFHEGLNAAGVFEAPVVFFCHNNQWAISTPVERQTASATIAQKAWAYGFDGVRVDGTDPLAVYEATRDALERARSREPGEGRPTLIEAEHYRLGAHSTADDPSVYRDGVPERWQRVDPLDRFRRFLRGTDRLDAADEAAIEDRVERRLEVAVEYAESLVTDPEAVFEHVYATPTPRIEAQRRSLAARREREGDGRGPAHGG